MRIVITADAAPPQVNGVVRALGKTPATLETFGHAVKLITPAGFRSVHCPTCSSIRLAVGAGRGVRAEIESLRPDCLHVATEGPIGHAARRWCLANRFSFTTSFHTRFPEYIRARTPVSVDRTYACLRRFHASAARTPVPIPGQRDRLAKRGFANLVLRGRGVDTGLFRPGRKDAIDAERPIFLFVGRVSVEKNLEAFLGLDIDGTRVVIGGGPDLGRLSARYPAVRCPGEKFGSELARHKAPADVFVFPSRTDTFGLVMLEAMACRVPIAAFSATGPVDVVEHGRTGILDEDLAVAVHKVLAPDPAHWVEAVRARSWEEATRTLESYLARQPGMVGEGEHRVGPVRFPCTARLPEMVETMPKCRRPRKRRKPVPVASGFEWGRKRRHALSTHLGGTGPVALAAHAAIAGIPVWQNGSERPWPCRERYRCATTRRVPRGASSPARTKHFRFSCWTAMPRALPVRRPSNVNRAGSGLCTPAGTRPQQKPTATDRRVSGPATSTRRTLDRPSGLPP